MAEKLMGMRVNREQVALSRIRFNRLNLRGILRSPDQIQQTAEAILEAGPINEPVLSQRTDGLLLICGECRIQARMWLVAQGYTDFDLPMCKVLESVNDNFAMKILAIENSNQGTVVPAATANEVFWHYRSILKETQDHKQAVEKSKRVWKHTERIFGAFIIPGWLLSHSFTVQRLLEIMGEQRALGAQVRAPLGRQVVDERRVLTVGRLAIAIQRHKTGGQGTETP